MKSRLNLISNKLKQTITLSDGELNIDNHITSQNSDLFRTKLLDELKEADKRYNNAKMDKKRIKQLITNYDKHIKQIISVEKNKNQNKKNTGFNKPIQVPDELADYIGLEKGTKLPRTKVTSKLYHKLIKEKKYYIKDKRVLRADQKIKTLFNLSDSVNTSTNPKDKNGFNFYNLQTCIASYYKKHNNTIPCESSDLSDSDDSTLNSLKKI